MRITKEQKKEVDRLIKEGYEVCRKRDCTVILKKGYSYRSVNESGWVVSM